MIAFAALAAVSLAQAAGAPATTPAPVPPPTVAPVLDKEKGERALTAYREFRRKLCAELRSKQKRAEPVAARLKAIGLEDVEPDQICGAGGDGKGGKALASGALLESGKDEVLLEVTTLKSAQTGQSLAVMRDDGKGYRLMRHMLDAAIFEVRLRLVAPDRRDILLLCDYSGLGGEYPGDCGFFGRGSFADPSAEKQVPNRDLDRRDDLALIELGEPCGPFSKVSAGKVSLQGDRLLVPLILEGAVRVPGPHDEEGTCSKRTKKTRRTFDIEYKFDGQAFRRLTPTPPAVKAVLDQG